MFVNVAVYDPVEDTTLSSETLLAIDERRVKPVPALPEPWNNPAPKTNSLANLVATVPVDALAVVVVAAAVPSIGATVSSPEYS